MDGRAARDPGPARRRPGADARRVPRPARRRGRHRGGGRGRGRGARAWSSLRASARRRPDRRTDAGRRRHRGDPAHRRRPGLAAVHVVILTNYGLDEYVFEALRAGAGGFLVKDTEPADLLQAIRVAARGDALLAPSVTRSLIGEFVARPPDRSRAAALDELTRREREVVALVARGLTNDEIAARMVISPLTAKTHVSRAMTKLHARDRAQLVVLAYESGLVAPRTTPEP